MVAGWTAEDQGGRIRAEAEAELDATIPGCELFKDEIRALKLNDIVKVLGTADTKLKQAAY